MNPVLQAAIGSILRHFLTMGASYLVARGIWTDADALTYASAASLAIVGMAWAIWQKSQAHALIEKALDMPQGSSREQLKDK